jgi:hypothetical protein
LGVNDDYEILGITGELTLDKLKRAYRARVKELHPDVNRDDDIHMARARTILTIEAYESLLRRLEDRRHPATDPKAGLAEDAGYELYKSGIELFQSVHPSKWKRVTLESLFTQSESGEVDSAGTVEILARLMGNLGEAKYCFTRVINEYATSVWAADAKDKLREIEAMADRYHRILESYRSEHRRR